MLGSLMLRQLSEAQTALLRSFMHDREFTLRATRNPHHAGISECLPPAAGQHVLELGCGPGKYVAALHTLGYRVTGVDPHSFPTWEMLRGREGVVLQDGVAAEALPFPDAHFDHVVCLGALLYFSDVLRALAEMRRVLKPGGRLLVKTVNRDNLYTKRTGRKLDPASKNLYTLESLRETLTAAGFAVDKSFTYGFWPPAFTNFWWYLVNVWFSQATLDRLSSMTPAEHRANLLAFCTRPPAQ